MNRFHDIGISARLDRQRIRKLLAIGFFASLLHVTGDMILGWRMKRQAVFCGYFRRIPPPPTAVFWRRHCWDFSEWRWRGCPALAFTV